MKTNQKLLPETGRTLSPSGTASVARVHVAALKGDVLLRGQYASGHSGRGEVIVSLDSAAVARKLAVAEANSTGSSTTGKASKFGSL